MESIPKVSVVIPVYNVENYLCQCLDSVLNQTLKDIEIICVDDGSTDNSSAILNEYKATDSRIHVITQENGGLSAARNSGLHVTRGQYVYFLDSDDYIVPETLSKLYSCASANDLDIVLFGAESFFENIELESTHSAYKNYYYRRTRIGAVLSGKELFQEFTDERMFRPSVPMQFFRTQFLIENKLAFFEGIIHEDELFSPQALLRAKRAMVIDDVFYMRRVRANSTMTSNVSARQFEGQFIVCAKLLSEALYVMESKQSGNSDYGMLMTRVKSMYSACRSTYQRLPKGERELVFRNANESIKFLFEKMRSGDFISAEELTKEKSGLSKEQENHLLKIKIRELEQEIGGIHKSVSFRVGRFMTFIPRKIRGGIRCYREHGLDYTFIRVMEHLHLNKLIYWKNKKRTSMVNKFKCDNSEIAISVIVPVYNSQDYLLPCLDSIRNQTLSNFELICIDDGSTDDSLKILQRIQEEDKRIQIIQQDNMYAGIARNRGMQVAKGKYLLFLDADDFFEATMLEKLYVEAENLRADVCLCAADRYQTRGKTFEPAGWLLNAKYLPKCRPFNRKDCSRFIFQITSPAPWTKLFRHDFIKRLQLEFQSLRRSNDLYFTLSALAQAERISVVDQVLVHYRVGTGQNLQSGNADTPLLFLYALDALKKELVRKDIWGEVAKSFSDLALNTTVYNLKSLSREPDKLYEALAVLKDQYIDEFEIFKNQKSMYSLPQNYEYIERLIKSER